MRRALCVALLTAAMEAAASRADAAELRRSVAANGGAPTTGAAGAGIVMRATVGQAIVGRSSGGGVYLHHGYWRSPAIGVLAVGDDPTATTSAAALSFGPPWPNPARGPVHFDLSLPAEARVRLRVFDALGRVVSEPSATRLAAGRHRLAWDPDGVESGAGAAGPGIYFARLERDGAVVATRRVTLVR